MKAYVRNSGVATLLISVLLSSGCTISNPVHSSFQHATSESERDIIYAASADVGSTPWPSPEPVSVFDRLTGEVSADRVTEADAVAVYLAAIGVDETGAQRLFADAEANLRAGDKLVRAAEMALGAPRLSMGDVAALERAIGDLRENRRVLLTCADKLSDSGVSIDDDDVDALRRDYAEVIRSVGKAADALAKRIDDDHRATFAQPDNAIGDPRDGV